MMHWYVMHTKPNKEFFLCEQLRLHQIEPYLPLIARIDRLHFPLSRAFFPGYLFVHIDLVTCGISPLLWIPGAKGIVCFGGEPAIVPDVFIQQLRAKMDAMSTYPFLKPPMFKAGDSVTIHSGPFEGFQAIFNQYLPEKDRVRLLLKTMAENSFYLEVPASQLAA